MCKHLGKRENIALSKLASLSKVETKMVYIEKKSGMPGKFKVPKPVIPSIKIKRGVFNANSRRSI